MTSAAAALFLLQCAAVVLAAAAGRRLMKRLGQPLVIGELLAGMALGPSLLGRALPQVSLRLFPPGGTAGLEALSRLGLILFMFYTGLETDLRRIRSLGRPALLASAFGMVLPFALGFALGWLAPAHLVGAADRRLFACFMGAAVSISAIPVISRILLDLGLFHRDVGVIILGAALVDDTTGWVILSALSGLAAGGGLRVSSLLSCGALVAAFIAACAFILYPLLRLLLRRLEGPGWREAAALAVMLLTAFACAAATEAIGIHPVFGAFAAGAVLAQCPGAAGSRRGRFGKVVMVALAPVFFAVAGLKTSLGALGGVFLPAVFIGVSCLGKIAGGALGGALGGLRPRQALSVGLGLNARGAMGLVVAAVGLSLGILNQASYAIVVLIALATTLMTPPLLRRCAGALEAPEEDLGRGKTVLRPRPEDVPQPVL